MNLQRHLLQRIVATALLCLIVTAALLLFRSDLQARIDSLDAADKVGRQLELQLLKWGATLRLDHAFPDLTNWQPNDLAVGDCMSFDGEDGRPPRHACNGVEPGVNGVPPMFESVYRTFFEPGATVSRPVVFHKHRYGVLTVIPSVRRELARAWTEISSLMTLAVFMVGTVCALVYWSVSRALAPSRLIVAGLTALENGDLDHRLPGFDLAEWRCIGSAINQLAATQQRLLQERQALAVQLIALQENERRELARELHDEFGQCLAAINALSLSITQSAREPNSTIADEAGRIRDICQHMLDGIRRLLCRLRPAELDELGLAASLGNLIATWSHTQRGRTDYALSITGNCAPMPEPITIALFRAVQEALTNVAKHAAATRVSVDLHVTGDEVSLRVTDDGQATTVPKHFGVGLLGMRERVVSLRGRMRMDIASPHGLIVDILLPLGGPK